MRHMLSWAAVALLVFLGGARVEADSNAGSSGTSSPDVNGSTNLAGVPSAATHEVARPALASSGTVSVGSPVFTSFDPGATPIGPFGETSQAGGGNAAGSGIDPSYLDPANGTSLAIDVSPGSTGAGPIIPTDVGSSGYDPSHDQDPAGGHVVSIAPGRSSALARFSNLISAGIAGLMLLGFYAHCHRAKRLPHREPTTPSFSARGRLLINQSAA